MSTLVNLLDISVINAEEVEQMWTSIVNAIDRLEEVKRARELTNIIWEINVSGSKTEQDWKRTEILLESYEKARDEPLESALSDLKELVQVMKNSNLLNRHDTL